ncbi:DUF6776 family protein [Thioalkalicoccus limnaeus]|uniref:DUF6776 family protein n=1 Tax=Thioalkalicoccus limnaeus TaxID=120681 RepID=A0ABV4BE30_9GAMM
MWLVSLASAFVAGGWVGQASQTPVAGPITVLEHEYASLARRLAEVQEEAILCERGCQIDQEATRVVTERLKAAQDERLALMKEVTYLRRLIQEGGGGAVHLHDLVIAPGSDPRLYHFRFTATQLIRDFGTSQGTIALSVQGHRDGDTETLAHRDLVDSEDAGLLTMDFRHFQMFEGRLRLPDGFEPEFLVIDVTPSTDGLIATTERFPWPTLP